MNEQIVRQYILTELGWQEDSGELTEDSHLLDGTVIDSMGVLQLVTFIEEEFGIEVLDEELVPEHFGTLGAITRLIDSKLTVSGRM